MSQEPEQKNDRSRSLRNGLRALRGRYDQLPRGQTAAIRRCKTADEIALEGVYWRIAAAGPAAQPYLAHVVLLFPLVAHRTKDDFAFGRYLRHHLGDGDGAALRFRRLLDCRDRDELDHRLRGVLKLAARDGSPVDWGVLGVDILWFFAESDAVRRRWAQDFYAPGASTDATDATTTATA